MTIVGSIVLKDDRALVFADTKVTGSLKDSSPQRKILHYGNLVIAGTGYLRYLQLLEMYINNEFFKKEDDTFMGSIKERKKKNFYEWDSDLLFIFFNGFFDWVNRKGWNFSLNSDEIISTSSFLVTTPYHTYAVVWGAIESANTWANLGSGAVVANSIYETMYYLNNEKINIKDYLSCIVNIVPKLGEGIEKPFYFSIVSDKFKTKRNFYDLELFTDKMVKIEDEEDINNFLKEEQIV